MDGDRFELAFDEVVVSDTARYRNLQLLGQGGNAATFLMLADAGPHRGVPFAVKFFRRLSKPEWKAGFLAEADFLQTCQHPSVIRYFDRGIARDEHPYFVAEYLPRTLRDVIRDGRTTIPTRLTYATQLLSALAYLEGRDRPVVHRDVKPENIFIKSDAAVLGDFGLHKLAPTSDADRLAIKASFGAGMPRAYRTPDLVAYFNGAPPPTPKSDVYQLGLVLAELFTGRNPQLQPREDDLSAPVELNPLAPIPGTFAEPVANLISSMLAERPDDRPTAGIALDNWIGILVRAAKDANALNGRVL